VNNSKAIGSIDLGYPHEKCDFMQTVTYLPFIQKYIPNVSDETMVVAVLCGSLMRFVAYNFYPSL
jgi:hypothetical protein